jgi:hypothetical protein
LQNKEAWNAAAKLLLADLLVGITSDGKGGLLAQVC